MYPVGERIVGSRKCKSANCKTCYNIREDNQFTSSSNGKTFKINHELNCNSKNVFYLLKCKVCEKQYVGQTTNPFRFRWNNYKSVHTKAAKGENVPQMSFHQHFLGADHHGLEKDVEITLIDHTSAFSPTQRENFWMFSLNTISPSGFNMMEEGVS